MEVLCEVGKMRLEDAQLLTVSQLSHLFANLILISYFQRICSHLQVCISQESSLLVVCQALDGVFDIFGDDRCPPSLFTSLSFMATLQRCQSCFAARVSVSMQFFLWGIVHAVKSLNKDTFWTGHFVLCREVVLFQT